MKATKADKILILTFFVLTILCFGAKSYFSVSGGTALLYVDGELVYKIALDRDAEYNIDAAYGTAKVAVSGGRLYMLESQCPQKICVGDSPIFKAGDSIVCLPNRIFIKISGGEAEGLDTFTK